MPVINSTAKIDVRAPADAAFAVVAGDLVGVDDDPDAMTGHRPLSEGPLREGFRWRQTLVHDRKECHSDWVVTEMQPERALEQTMRHFCAVAQREIRGGERWEFTPCDDGSTLVTLRVWRLSPGVVASLRKVLGLGLGQATVVGLQRRLAAVQFRAERL